MIGPDGTVQTRAVSVAQISDGQALIDSGLQANETVVLKVNTGSSLEPSCACCMEALPSRPILQSAVEQAIP